RFFGQGRWQGDRSACSGLDAVGTNGPRDVLEAQFAERDEAAVELSLQMVVGGARDDDNSGIGNALEASGDVDTVAIEVAVLFADHIAKIDAYAQADTLFLKRTCFVLHQGLLDRHSGGHCVDDTGKLAQHPVAGEFEYPAAML